MAGKNGDIAKLIEVLGTARVRTRVSLAPFTTIRIGGPADLFYEAETAEELAAAVIAARETGVPFFLLGLGANLLVGDRGIRGLVIRNTSRSFRIDRKTRLLSSDSGAIIWPDMIEAALDAELSGLEHYAGIPSTVGGALWQNLHFLSPAPARERTVFIEEVLESVDILTPDNVRRTVDPCYFEFGYDQSILHRSGDVVLSAAFRLEPGDGSAIRRIIEENLTWRREKHPPLASEPSAGSIFKKIDGIGAGRLIDECGLKGARIGGAEITRRHANIMINRSGATASDVRELIRLVIRTVEERKGYTLKPEISFVGEF